MTADAEKITSFFSQPLRAANVGLDRFADALAAQGVPVTRVDWRPPVVEPDPAAVALFHAPEIAAANQQAVERLMGAQPILVDVRPAREALPGMGARTFFHAGPPIDWAHASGPLRGALI